MAVRGPGHQKIHHIIYVVVSWWTLLALLSRYSEYIRLVLPGNYRSAHDVLLGMCQQLRHNRLAISSELLSSLMLLHSYILVRLHVCRGDHGKAACMLVRVTDNMNQFPCRKCWLWPSARSLLSDILISLVVHTFDTIHR